MTTDDSTRWRAESLPGKAARVRRLSDPLGAWGFRRPQARIARETRFRQAVLAAVVAVYLAIVGALYASQPAQETAAPLAIANPDRNIRIETTTEEPHTTTRES